MIGKNKKKQNFFWGSDKLIRHEDWQLKNVQNHLTIDPAPDPSGDCTLPVCHCAHGTATTGSGRQLKSTEPRDVIAGVAKGMDVRGRPARISAASHQDLRREGQLVPSSLRELRLTVSAPRWTSPPTPSDVGGRGAALGSPSPTLAVPAVPRPHPHHPCRPHPVFSQVSIIQCLVTI